VLEPVKIEEKEVLRKLLKDYQQEIKGPENPGEYKYLDSYWKKEDRKAFFIKIGKSVGGFVLINNHTVLKREAKSISEFYIVRSFRGRGIGRVVAEMVFESNRGKWEVAEMDGNILAQKFWRNVINEYTNGNFEEIALDNDRWHGPVQIFEN